MRLRIFSLVSLGLYLLTALILFTDRPSSRVSVPVGAANPQILASYGKLPLSFEVNRGQTDEEVEFLSRGKGYTLFLTSTDAVLSLRKGSAEPEAQVPRLVNDRGGTGVSPVAGTPLPNRNVLAERPAGKAWAELRPESSAHILKAKGTNLPEGLSPAEWSDIQKQIRDSEYELAPAEPGTPGVPRTGWQALNWAQDLRAYFNEERIQVVPRREPEPSWEWGLTLKSYGYQGRTRPVRTAERVAGGNRIEYRRGDLTEWYVNEERGLEQGFTLAAPPGARGEDFLSIELDLSGTLVPKLTEDGTAILFEDRRGRTILRYSGLLAWDAGGRELLARMAVERGEVSIRVDDRGAVYPVTIDPIVTQEAKLTASDAAVGEEFGFSVAVAGDTVVVGARFDAHVGTQSGSAYVIVRSGTSWSEQAKLTASDAAADDFFGNSVAVAGGTVVVGARDNDDLGSSSGSAYVFVRSGTSWSEQAKLTASDGAEFDQFGGSVAVAGNTVVVGAHQVSTGVETGSAYVFRAPALALDPASLTFADQAVGTTSDPQTVSVTNVTGGAVTIDTILASGDFAATDDCGTSVGAGASCTISVTFTPTATGARTGETTITFDGPGSPQTIVFSGTGTDFSISTSSGSPDTIAVSAGQSATHDLTLSPDGFSGNVSLSCSGAPTAATCTVAPSSVTLDGMNDVTAEVTVTTTAPGMLAPPAGPQSGMPWLPWLLGLAMTVALAEALRRRTAWAGRLMPQRAWPVVAATLLFAALWASCGSGGSPGGGGGGGIIGTPAGTFTLTVTATSGGVSRTIPLTLIVN